MLYITPPSIVPIDLPPHNAFLGHGETTQKILPSCTSPGLACVPVYTVIMVMLTDGPLMNASV